MPLLESLSTHPPSWLILVAGVFVVAGLVKGGVGLGLPTVSMALLGMLMAPAEAAALLIVPSLVTNLWQIGPLATLGTMLRRIGPMQVGIGVGTLGGAWLFGAPAGTWAAVSLGVALVGYAVWGIAGATLAMPPATERWLGALAGAMTGLVTAATGVFVVPAVPYLQALGLQRDALVQAMGISFTVSTLALAVGLHLNARYSGADLATSVLVLLPALAGMAVGQWLRRRVSPPVFRNCLFISLAALGLHMVVRELMAL